MIEDCRYVLIPVYKKGEKNKPLYFHTSTEIVAFLHLKGTTQVSTAILKGSKLRKKYFVDLNADYVFDKSESADMTGGKKVITDIYGLV